jgi:hypothetical protein
MITGLPDGYDLQMTPKGYLLSSERLVYRNNPNDKRKEPLIVGSRHVAVLSPKVPKGVIRDVAILDAQNKHAEVSEVMRKYGAGVIRWGGIDTNG